MAAGGRRGRKETRMPRVLVALGPRWKCALQSRPKIMVPLYGLTCGLIDPVKPLSGCSPVLRPAHAAHGFRGSGARFLEGAVLGTPRGASRRGEGRVARPGGSRMAAGMAPGWAEGACVWLSGEGD